MKMLERTIHFLSQNEPWMQMEPTNITNDSLVPAKEVWPPCQHYIISQYLIPDILHSSAYAFSFYMYRVTQTEQIPVLMEKVFNLNFFFQFELLLTVKIMLIYEIKFSNLKRNLFTLYVSLHYQVFLQTSATQSGFLSQGKLIRNLR